MLASLPVTTLLFCGDKNWSSVGDSEVKTWRVGTTLVSSGAREHLELPRVCRVGLWWGTEEEGAKAIGTLYAILGNNNKLIISILTHIPMYVRIYCYYYL